MLAAVWWLLQPGVRRADPANAEQVALGRTIYGEHCARCHGPQLEGQPNWRTPNASGRLPAPPHDKTGHTWHHSDADLFEVTKHSLRSLGPAGYQTDMPAFETILSDAEIWAVLAYIKSAWPPMLQAAQMQKTVQQERQ